MLTRPTTQSCWRIFFCAESGKHPASRTPGKGMKPRTLKSREITGLGYSQVSLRDKFRRSLRPCRWLRFPRRATLNGPLSQPAQPVFQAGRDGAIGRGSCGAGDLVNLKTPARGRGSGRSRIGGPSAGRCWRSCRRRVRASDASDGVRARRSTGATARWAGGRSSGCKSPRLRDNLD